MKKAKSTCGWISCSTSRGRISSIQKPKKRSFRIFSPLSTLFLAAGSLSALTLLPGCGPKETAPAGPPDGAALMQKYGCAYCHQTASKGPSLSGVTARKTYAWFDTFLQNPSAFNPSSTMPRYHLNSEES